MKKLLWKINVVLIFTIGIFGFVFGSWDVVNGFKFMNTTHGTIITSIILVFFLSNAIGICVWGDN